MKVRSTSKVLNSFQQHHRSQNKLEKQILSDSKRKRFYVITVNIIWKSSMFLNQTESQKYKVKNQEYKHMQAIHT